MRANSNSRKSMFYIRNLTYIAISVALLCVSAWITIPGTVPFTLQTFAVFLILGLLGAKNGLFAILIYILLGIIGLPVFASFKGGIGVILGPTGGYILGFIFSAFIYYIFSLFIKNENVLYIFGSLLGLLGCYFLGTIWFYYIYSDTNTISLSYILMVCVIPFIIPDILKIIISFIVLKNIKKRTKYSLK